MSFSVISDSEIEESLKKLGFIQVGDEGRLMLLELLSKAAAGFYNSHTEELFLCSFNIIKKDRTPNKKGFRFICEMVYASSNKRPKCYDLITNYRG